MDGTNLTKDQFLKDVENHSLKVIKDDGLYRHLECSNNGSFCQRFEIITWPGYLAYVGDMGDYVFSRIEDMFAFFRNKKQEIEINPGYWAEKVKAESVFGGGIREFSVEQFRECVLESARSHFGLDEDAEIPEEIMEEIRPLLRADDEYECVETMRNFRSDKMEFYDFWEHGLTKATLHYIWCCYAIVWAISKYDEAKEANPHA